MIVAPLGPSLDIHPDMRDLLAAKEATPTSEDASALRAGWNAYSSRLSRPYPASLLVNDERIPCTNPGLEGGLAVRFYRPKAAPSPSPCVIYLHDGAFIKGSLDSGDSIAWGVAEQVGVVVVSVDYRLAPEHPFPAGVEDCFAAIRYLAEHGGNHSIDPKRIAIWGDSAGGNLAAAVCLMARDRGGPKIAAQALNYPCLTDDLSAEAFTRFGDAPGLRTKVIDDAWTLYLGGERPSQNAYAAPLKAANFGRLPPAHVHYAEYDCLADDARRYASLLKRAGGVVAVRCAERMLHGFLRARFTGPDAAAEFAAPCEFLKIHLAP